MSAAIETPTLPIVSVGWLEQHLHHSEVRIVEASWHMPAAGRDAREEFAGKHITGAVFFDIDEHSAPSHLPHMLPDAGQFATAAGALGIAAHHKIIVYDSLGLFSAARVWWMFRHFGASEVYVLDGGLPAWERVGGSIDSLPDSGSTVRDNSGQHEPCEFIVESSTLQRQRNIVNASEILAAIDDHDCVTLDARSAGRFTAEEKEVRPGLRSGHIPGSISLPFTQLLDGKGSCKSVPELVSIFEELGLKPTARVITTCGSGVTAAVICLALECAGYSNVSLYDGSWTEWGSLDDVPVATGAGAGDG